VTGGSTYAGRSSPKAGAGDSRPLIPRLVHLHQPTSMSRWSRVTAVGRTRVIGSSGWPSRRVWAMTLFAISCTTRSRLGYGSAGRVLARMGSSALGLENVTTQEDISQVAAQLAELTQTVEAMAKDLKAMTERADTQEARADTQEVRADTQEARADNWQTIAGGQDVLALKQQERIDLAARELADVSHRLQAAATLLQESGVYSAPISRKRLGVE
jgi:hypothetical protein